VIRRRFSTPGCYNDQWYHDGCISHRRDTFTPPFHTNKAANEQHDRMKKLYLLSVATAFAATSAMAQSGKDPSGVPSEFQGLKTMHRTATWVNELRGGGPANDECSGAITMTVGSNCQPTNGSLAGATQSQAPATCSGFTASAANDVWFTFTANTPTTIISVTGAGTSAVPDTLGIDPVLQVFSGTCGNLTSIGCLDATFPGGSTEIGQLATTPGTTYYYRIYYWPYGLPPTDYSFTTCVYGLQAPANDDCSGALALSPNAWCSPVLASGTGATQSLPAATCNNFTGNANDDIWFSFVASETSMTIGAIGAADPNPAPPNTGYDPVVEAFDACGGTSLGCVDATIAGEAESLELTGLTVGNTYYFRVYHYLTAMADPFVVSVCVVDGSGINIGMPEWASAQDWLLFPNPAHNTVTLSYNGRTGTGVMEVFDTAGRVAYEEQSTLVAGSSLMIDVQDLAPGVYVVRLTVNGQRSEQRLMID
jgi:hypothetical protein